MSTPENLKEIIADYEEKLAERPPNEPEPAHIYWELGRLYGKLSAWNTPDKHLPKALSYFQRLQSLFDNGLQDETLYANAMNDWGVTYQHLAEFENPAENLKKASELFQKALKHWNLETNRHSYTGIHINLAALHLDLARLENEEANLNKAIEFSLQTIRINEEQIRETGRSSTETDRQIAFAQDNLGQAYIALGRLKKDRALFVQAQEVLQKSIDYFRTDYQLDDLAISVTNYAEVFYQLAIMSKERTDWLKAVEMLKDAAHAAQEAGNFLQFNNIQANLGYAYYQLLLSSKTQTEIRQYYNKMTEIVKSFVRGAGYYELPRALYFESIGFAAIQIWQSSKELNLLRFAEVSFEEAIELGFSTTNTLHQGRVHHQLAFAQSHLGQQKQARDNIYKAIRFYEEAKRPDLAKDAEAVLEVRGNFWGRFGDWFNQKRF